MSRSALTSGGSPGPGRARLLLAAALLLAATPGWARGLAAEGPVDVAFAAAQRVFEDAQGLQASRPTDREAITARYREAAEGFERIGRQPDGATTAVFTNTANAYAFSGDNGKAVLYYRRALALEPSNARARAGLESIRATLPFKRAASTTTSIVRSLFFWHEGVSFSMRLTAFLVLFPLGFVALGVAALGVRKARGLAWCALALSLALLGSLLTTAFFDSSRRDGVLLVQAQGRLGDGPAYSPSHSRPFPAGTEVSMRESRASADGSAWSLVTLPDGTESWVPRSALERVIPD